MINNIKKEFTQIPNALINDKELDRSARFLFVYLCSKPADWRYFTREIEAGLGCSKDSRLKYMNILLESGWISTRQKRLAGEWGENEIVLHARPEVERPKISATTPPQQEFPAAVNYRSGKNPLHTNTNNNTNTNLFSNTKGAGLKKLSEEVLNYLNEKKPSSIPFKKTAANLSKIEARIKEKYTLEDFCKVIDYKIKDWEGSDKTRKWIRPETLFGSKFNGYLIAANDSGPKDGSGNFKYQPTKNPIFTQ